jgi:hypothetical protein
MQRLARAPEAAAVEDGKQAARDATTSPLEKRRQAISRDPKFLAGDPVLAKEMRRILAALESPEETETAEAAPLEEQRERFGLTPPGAHVIPQHQVEQYEQEFGGHEVDFLNYARSEGIDPRTVRDLRDAGIRLAIEADGKPVTAEALLALGNQFRGRITLAQFKTLAAWWRSRVEPGAPE